MCRNFIHEKNWLWLTLKEMSVILLFLTLKRGLNWLVLLPIFWKLQNVNLIKGIENRSKTFYFCSLSSASCSTTLITGNTCCSCGARHPLCSSSCSICCNLLYLLTCSARTGPPSLMKRAPKATAWKIKDQHCSKKFCYEEMNEVIKNQDNTVQHCAQIVRTDF